MKKLTAMLLSLVMCFSLLAIPAQAITAPDPDGADIVDVGGSTTEPGDGEPDEPKDPAPAPDRTLPYPLDDIPMQD